jgi:GH24 family phage-related lysozyme (muramidase)
MDINERGLKLLYDFEGRHTRLPDGRYKAYLDKIASPPVWTLYAGLTKGIREGMCCTEAQGDAMVRKELNVYENAIEEAVKVPLTSNEFSALTVLVYNIGVGAFQKSTLLKVINQGKRDQIPSQWLRWNKAGGKVIKGLERRRKAEVALFLAPDEVEVKADDEPSMPQRVEESKGSVKETVATSWTIRGALAALAGAATQAYDWALPAATEAGAEAMKLKTSFGPWEALFAALKANMGLLAAAFVAVGCGIVIARRIHDAREFGR